jgi:hypothetical protein
MDIHKPKLFHGWRELAKEVGIIVIGVLIALGAEQTAAALHERSLAEETRATARAELSAALNDFVKRRATEACINRRLDEVTALLAAADKPGYAAPSWIGRPQLWGLVTSGWDAAASGGRVALLSAREQAELGGLYTRLHQFYAVEQAEQIAWADVRQLENLPRPDAATRASVRSALQQARYDNWQAVVNLEQTEQAAEKLRIVKPPARLAGSPAMCLPTTTPRAEAVAKVEAFFGDKLGEP